MKHRIVTVSAGGQPALVTTSSDANAQKLWDGLTELATTRRAYLFIGWTAEFPDGQGGRKWATVASCGAPFMSQVGAPA